jgi:hypothetical protein
MSDLRIKFTARNYAYLGQRPHAGQYPNAQPWAGAAGEKGTTLTFEWDPAANLVTAFTWITSATTPEPSSICLPSATSGATETWELAPRQHAPWNAVVMSGYYFELSVPIKLSSSVWFGNVVKGKLTVNRPANDAENPRAATLAAIVEGTGTATLIAFGDLSGDLPGPSTYW